MSEARLSVISYNLKDYGKSAVATRRQQHELLRFQRPDVVCLQEIWDDGDDLAELRRHLATIAEALGMQTMPVPARRSHCHMAILWRPKYAALSQRSHGLTLWHGLGVVQLDVGADVLLRVAVTHLAPWDPEQRLSDARAVAGTLDDPGQATVIAGDWNSLGADDSYDPEPDWSKLRPGEIWRHVRWSDEPAVRPQADRRPAQLLHRSGLYDAAACHRRSHGWRYPPAGGCVLDHSTAGAVRLSGHRHPGGAAAVRSPTYPHRPDPTALVSGLVAADTETGSAITE